MSQSPVNITPGTGGASIAAELVSGTSFQQIEVYGGGGASVMSVNPDGSLKVSVLGTITAAVSSASVVQQGTWIVSIVSTVPSSVIVGASIFGQLPAGTAPIGSVAVLQGTNPWIITGSVQSTAAANQSVSGAVTIAGTVAVTESGTWNVSVVSTVPSSVLVGASIFGALPGGNAVLGGVAASISGTVAVTVVGSVLAYQAPLASLVSGISSVITGTAVTSVLAKSAGGQKNYITNILVTNQQTSVTGAGAQVNIIDDGSAQVMYSGYAAAGGGGFSLAFPTPLVQPTSTFSVSAKVLTQASVIVGISGFTA